MRTFIPILDQYFLIQDEVDFKPYTVNRLKQWYTNNKDRLEQANERQIGNEFTELMGNSEYISSKAQMISKGKDCWIFELYSYYENNVMGRKLILITLSEFRVQVFNLRHY